VSEVIYVHYAKAPIHGDYVLPWDELSPELRATAGHEGKVHVGRFRNQYRSDRVYLHILPTYLNPLHLGAGYATAEAWVYEVIPEGGLNTDPELNGHLVTSRICERARVVRCLHEPNEPTRTGSM
jgi:hypothetical protein